MRISQKGVTIIELLIVITIIAIIAGISIAALNPVKQFQKARDTRRKADIAQIQQALELYRSDVRRYPDAVNCDGPLQNGSVVYLRNVPCDPKSDTSYVYGHIGADVNTYQIRVCLENTSDTDGVSDGFCTKDYIRQNP